MISFNQNSLRHILIFDAVSCAAMGIVLFTMVEPINAVTAVPSALLMNAGMLLFPIALFMVVAAFAGSSYPALVWVVIAGNIAWLIASVASLFVIEPNSIGVALVLAQAAFVGLLAYLEHRAWRHLNGVLALQPLLGDTD